MKAIVYSSGTSEENKASAQFEDTFVFPVLVPNPSPRTKRYAGAKPHPDGIQWLYPVTDASEPILVANNRGPIVVIDELEWFPPPPPPEMAPSQDA